MVDENKQTDEKDETPKPDKETPKETEKPLNAESAPVSVVDTARELIDIIRKEKVELKAEREKLEKVQAENLLSGTAGGHIETKQLSPEDVKKANAKEFFKDTALGDAIAATAAT